MPTGKRMRLEKRQENTGDLMGHNMIHHSIDPNSLFLGAIGLSFVYNPFLCTPGIFCDEPISMTHNSSSLISYLIWRSKDTRFTFYFLSGCYLHDETLMMERFTDRWIQHYFSYHKCPPNRIITGRQAFGGVTRLCYHSPLVSHHR